MYDEKDRALKVYLEMAIICVAALEYIHTSILDLIVHRLRKRHGGGAVNSCRTPAGRPQQARSRLANKTCLMIQPWQSPYDSCNARRHDCFAAL